MLTLWLLVLGITASPDLHGKLHRDSQSPTHTCIVTQLQQQSFLSSTTLLVAPLPTLIPRAVALLAHIVLLEARDVRLADGRAPPLPCPAFTVAG